MYRNQIGVKQEDGSFLCVRLEDKGNLEESFFSINTKQVIPLTETSTGVFRSKDLDKVLFDGMLRSILTVDETIDKNFLFMDGRWHVSTNGHAPFLIEDQTLAMIQKVIADEQEKIQRAIREEDDYTLNQIAKSM